MREFQKPNKLFYDPDTLTATLGQFHAQPFERGFATTVGHSLRRVLLSAIEGAALTAVKIDGVLHEFSSIPGVREDVTDIIMNLRQVPLILHSGEPKTLHLEAAGEGEIKSGDFKPDPDVEILDSDIHIATLNQEASITMEVRVKNGRGYVPANENHDEDLSLGYIAMDSVHSPVRRANFHVEAARLGQSTEYERLNLEVVTNGSVAPQDAVAQAAQILKEHLFMFINFEEDSEEDVVEEDEDQAVNENLIKPVEELELSVRAYNCLKNASVETIGELVVKTEAEMLKTKNFGRKSLSEIKELLAEMGLSFGMKIDGKGRLVRETTEV
ncbi:MAG: DNA-directed RNA polymerase subunit alpha [Candidatus Aminicenantes bacterium]|nr:DNA-directed RNA polymerase subunit alpha [Candidatus Aminicenantes bacterium]